MGAKHTAQHQRPSSQLPSHRSTLSRCLSLTAQRPSPCARHFPHRTVQHSVTALNPLFSLRSVHIFLVFLLHCLCFVLFFSFSFLPFFFLFFYPCFLFCLLLLLLLLLGGTCLFACFRFLLFFSLSFIYPLFCFNSSNGSKMSKSCKYYTRRSPKNE